VVQYCCHEQHQPCHYMSVIYLQRQVWFILLADECGRGLQVKLWDPLRTRAVPECLRGVFTTRHYANPRLPLPLPLHYLCCHFIGVICTANRYCSLSLIFVEFFFLPVIDFVLHESLGILRPLLALVSAWFC